MLNERGLKASSFFTNMSMKILAILLLIIIIILFNLSLEKLRRKVLLDLDQILYVQKNINLYLERLNNSRLKLIFSKASLEHFRFNAYIIANDDEKIKKSVSYLDNAFLGKQECLEYNLTKLSYACLHQEKEMASNSKEKILKILKNPKTQKQEAIKEETETIYSVYIDKDSLLIDPLKDKAKSQNGIDKGISYFRIAKLYYAQNDEVNAKHYLSLAKPLLANSSYMSYYKENKLSNLDRY